jgi:hypothetical protein
MQVTEMLNLSGQADLLFVETRHNGTVHGYVRSRPAAITTQGKVV